MVIQIKSYDEINNSLEASAKRMFGDDVDLTPGSPIKMLIDMFAMQMTGLWAGLRTTYESAYVTTATGASLDNLAALVGLERNVANAATGQVTFFRSTALPAGTPRVIPAGTIVKTAAISATRYMTTSTVYFQSTITDEAHVISTETDTFNCTNVIHSITAIKDADGNDLTVGATFTYRTVTLAAPVSAGKTLLVTYRPLSVTAPIRCEDVGATGNAPANTITVMDSPLDFIHSVSNELSLDTGYDRENDASLRYRLISAAQSAGKATVTALEYYLSRVPGVTTVTIEDPMRSTHTEDIVSDGVSTFYVSNVPLHSVISVTGSVSGEISVMSINSDTGSITLNQTPANGETLTVVYRYLNPGKIKIYVDGGEVGDANTPDTIVYAIETTRAAGVQSVGYASGDSNAFGSDTAPFSWFYRTERALIDVAMTISFNSSSALSHGTRSAICDEVSDALFDYINALKINDRLYKSKLMQTALAVNAYIVDVRLDSWSINGVSKSTNLAFIQGSDMETPLAQNISILNEVV